MFLMFRVLNVHDPATDVDVTLRYEILASISTTRFQHKVEKKKETKNLIYVCNK